MTVGREKLMTVGGGGGGAKYNYMYVSFEKWQPKLVPREGKTLVRRGECKLEQSSRGWVGMFAVLYM